MGFIYKITNIKTGKMYIGQTKEKDPEKRWKGHTNAFSKGKGCPALRDAVGKYGIENFRFEVLIICFDEARFEIECEYIKRFNTIAPNGYNILEGGVGGAGFKGKSHSEATRVTLADQCRKRTTDPEYKRLTSERTREQMRKVKESGLNWGEKVRNSIKYKKAIEEGRVGAAGKSSGPSEATKKKTSESLKKYFAETKSERTEIRRKSMAKSVGVKVQKLDLENNLISTYDSIADAARSIEKHKNTISQCLKGKCKTAGGFKWRKATQQAVDC